MNFTLRRRELLRRLGGGVAIVTASPEVIRSNDSHYPYRQDNDFYYLTGFTEPQAVAVLSDLPDAPSLTLFVRPRDPERETWDGPRAGVDGARETYGADRAHAIADLAQELPALIERAEQVAFTPGRDDALATTIQDTIRAAQRGRQKKGHGPTRIVDLTSILHEMRLVKEAEELDRMRRAAEITRAAHAEALALARPGAHEYEVDAIFDYTVRRMGGMGPAYPTIVASGANACTLHHVTNNRRMEDGDLLLIDAGAEYEHFASDVTRTFPVSGRFTAPQREIYDIVLEAQLQAIEKVRPGAKFTDAHDAAVRVIVDGLLRLKVLTGSADDIIKEEKFKPYYMHRTGHWLGLDVHDVGTYIVNETSRTLEPGMVLTVEPGLYFSPTLEGIPDELRGIGVRIEDDILVTAGGHEILTEGIPKTVADVEAALAARDAARPNGPPHAREHEAANAGAQVRGENARHGATTAGDQRNGSYKIDAADRSAHLAETNGVPSVAPEVRRR
jgi:Xaa-Pro aminopeptidase